VRTLSDVILCGGSPWLGGAIAQLDELVHRQVRHTATSSPSQRRSRSCARASWDFEKLVVFPIISPISAWVYPSTSCSHLEIHPQEPIFSTIWRYILMQFFRLTISISPETHQGLAGGNGPDPSPNAPVPPVFPDAARYFEEGLLQHVLGILNRATDTTGHVIYRHLERAVQRLKCRRISPSCSCHHTIGIGQRIRVQC
jgi:hypothetical protein